MYLSQSFISDCAFEWFEKKYKGYFAEDLQLIDFLISKGEEAIKLHRVSLPISFLYIQKPFKVGNVIFSYLSKDSCSAMIDNLKAKIDEQEAAGADWFPDFEVKFRKKYQGAVFANVSIKAEQERSIEIAKEMTQKALTVLRYFSPSAFIPEIPCYFDLMGQTEVPKSYSFSYENDSRFPLIQESVDEKRRHRWDIGINEVIEINRMGLEAASALVFKENHSEFEDSVVKSMYLFGRAIKSRDFQDKIVYALVAAETLMLQNQTESVQSNIGLRLAFWMEPDSEMRKKIKTTINSAYKYRSSFIHHGKIKEEWALLRLLQNIVWAAIKNAIDNIDRFKTREEFFNFIENRILS